MSRSPEPTSVFSRIRRGRSGSPKHELGDKVRKEGGVFNRLRVREEVCPHTQKVVTKVLVQEERNPFLRNVTMKEHPHEVRRCSQKVKTVEEDTRSQSRKNQSQVLKKTTYHNHGNNDMKDHLKIFQATAKVERWAMPTWCHMFNSTLTGFARGEVAASNQAQKKTLLAWKQQEAGRKQNFDKREDFRNQQRSEWRRDKFTLLKKIPKGNFGFK
nr:reverse transcriptase domain-containing protein [Tanacetum cinerariifolium]